MQKIYILLSRTDTVPARLIRTFTTGEFSHASISIYPRTDMFYSFARRLVNNPLIAGFVSENIHTKVFARYPYAHCAVFSLDVTDEGYRRAKRTIAEFIKNRRIAKYSFLGAAGMKLNLKVKRKYKFTCSQFVAFVLRQTKEVKLPKDYSLMMPNDFLDIEGLTLIYDGILKDCTIPLICQ